MSRIEWTDELKTGVQLIDQQHERLVTMLGALQDQLAALNPRGFRRLVHDLVSYTRYHFHTEENLMSARKWEEYESHKAAHAVYRTRLLEIEQHLLTAGDDVAAHEIEALLLDFVNRHVRGEDRTTWVSMKEQGLV